MLEAYSHHLVVSSSTLFHSSPLYISSRLVTILTKTTPLRTQPIDPIVLHISSTTQQQTTNHHDTTSKPIPVRPSYNSTTVSLPFARTITQPPSPQLCRTSTSIRLLRQPFPSIETRFFHKHKLIHTPQTHPRRPRHPRRNRHSVLHVPVPQHNLKGSRRHEEYQ